MTFLMKSCVAKYCNFLLVTLYKSEIQKCGQILCAHGQLNLIFSCRVTCYMATH